MNVTSPTREQFGTGPYEVVGYDATVAPESIAVKQAIHLSVLIPITVLVAILFIAVYFQLLLILYRGYKLVSYQTVFLFSVLLWAALRLLLYSFYYYDCCYQINSLSPGVNWFIIAFPQNIQYFTLSLLVLYFGQTLFKAIRKRDESLALVVPRSKKQAVCKCFSGLLWVLLNATYFTSNLGFSLYLSIYCKTLTGDLTLARVLTSELLFFVMAATLAVFIIIIYTTSYGRSVLEAQGTSKCKAIFLSFSLILIYMSRCLYNIIVVQQAVHEPSYGFGWTNASDLGDNEWKSPNGYISYLLVLLVWEVIPTYLIVIYFRVKMPSCRCRRSSLVTIRNVGTDKSYFFNNPKRYDSDEDSSTQRFEKSMKVDIPKEGGAVGHHGFGYGSINPSNVGYVAPSHEVGYFKSPNQMPGTCSDPLITPGKGGTLFSN